ncbi:MAG: hypothetical protein IPM16_07155 [Chloroflexi bacterium]|nr:hypothetical protein [Chloroflexota bacterium]
MANKTHRPEDRPRFSLTERVMAWPRYGRMGLVFVSVLALALALQTVADEIYIRLFYTGEQSTASTWVVAIICLSMYMAGYVFVIGTPGIKPQVGRIQKLYIVTSFSVIIVSVLWLVLRTVSAVLQ